MKLQIIFSCIIFFLLQACATAYKPTANMLELKKNMSKTEAAETFSRLIMKTDAGGICFTSQGWSMIKNTKPEVSETGFKADVIATEIVDTSVTRQGNNLVTSNKYRKFKATLTFNFSDIGKVRITGKMLFCGNDDSRYTVHLIKSVNDQIQVDVAPNELDNFMAAISILMPQANLIEGAGF